MAAKDIFHQQVRRALEKDGWKITHDPLTLPWGATALQIDLGAERLLAAEKAEKKIAVEIKSFLGRSRIEDLESALGQLVLYRHLLRRLHPTRELFLAVHTDIFETFLGEPHVAELLEIEGIWLLIFNPLTEEIVKWINWTDIEIS